MLTLALPARAQAVTWEVLPLIPGRPGQDVAALDFLRGEGAQASDPTADTLVAFNTYGPLLYNPSDAAGAAGSNGEWGAWHALCTASGCNAPHDGLVTAAGTFVIGAQAGATAIARGTRRGRTWQFDVYDDLRAAPFVELSLPAFAGPDGTPRLLAGTGAFDGYSVRSAGDGAAGTWEPAGLAGGIVEALGVVPPSPALPNGRVLAGVWNGVTYSDDGGLTYQPSSAFGQARFIAYSFAFLPQPGHPYGGVAYVGLHNTALSPGPAAELHRSSDGGATWVLAHRFTAAEMELPVFTGGNDVDLQDVTALTVTPDGVLWAAVGFGGGASNPARGGIARSTDGGVTWSRADAGYRDATGRGYAVNQLKLSRTGVLYAATERGVWRTTDPVVAGEASPAAALDVAVSVRPNPAGGRVEVVVSLTAAQAVRVVVVDALGREVAVVLGGATAAGERVASVDTSSWPVGVYVVRATAGAQVASARLVVTR